jgi:hypothetical protein
MVDNQYIINFNPNFLFKNTISKKTVQTVEEKLQLAISIAFRNLSSIVNLDIQKYPLTNKCDLVRNELGEILNNWQMNVTFLETQEILGDDVIGHSILLVTDYNTGKKYLADPTYSQFFLKDKCSKANLFIKNEMVLLAPDPGYYYLNNPDKIWFAKSLLENGYFELTEKNIKIYFDSFYKTRRGRSAYNDLSTTPIEISGNMYLNFLENVVNKKNKITV